LLYTLDPHRGSFIHYFLLDRRCDFARGNKLFSERRKYILLDKNFQKERGMSGHWVVYIRNDSRPRAMGSDRQHLLFVLPDWKLVASYEDNIGFQ
jgi:hypothetical protein